MIREIKQVGLLAFFMPMLVACSTEDHSFFPLESRRWWEYQEILLIRDEEQIRRRIIQNLDPINDGAKELFIQESQGDERQFFSISSKGIFREVEGGQQLILPSSAKVGDSWTLPSRLGVIESRTFAKEDRILSMPRPIQMTYRVVEIDDVVRVKAGHFTHCLKVEGSSKTIVPVDRHNGTAEVEVTSIDWYAQGVGLIKSERVEKSKSTFLKTGFYTLELLKAQE